MIVRHVIATLALLALAGCTTSTDTWIAEQTDRLTAAGVTFPPEQARNTIINMVTACVFRESGDHEHGRRTYMTTTPLQADWISPVDAGKMYDLADQEFCDSVPDGPLGEQ